MKLFSIVNLLAQTAEQKNATLVGLCLMAGAFMLLCMDKSAFKKPLKWILLGFMVLFMAAAILYYFLVVRR